MERYKVYLNSKTDMHFRVNQQILGDIGLIGCGTDSDGLYYLIETELPKEKILETEIIARVEDFV